MTQSIRPSQFITTYGPGAILETQDGPVIILSPEIGLFYKGSNYSPNDYKIHDINMIKLLSKNNSDSISIFRLPTDDEFGYDLDKPIYKTKPFPIWNLCTNKQSHKSNTNILHIGEKCPLCGYTGRSNAIGFVTVCKKGHLDDVNWNYVIHSPDAMCLIKNSNVDYFFWDRKGGSLRDIEIKCPKCSKSKNFGNVYYNHKLKCSGRHPHKETKKFIDRKGCNLKAKIIQRQAANIRIPEIKTLLSVQSVTELTLLAQNESIQAAIKVWNSNNPDDLISLMRTINVPEASIRKFQNGSLDEIKLIKENLNNVSPYTYHALISDEFNELVKSSYDGAPDPKYKTTSKPIFKVNKNDTIECKIKNDMEFIITPINMLRTVSIQIGFKRDDVEDELYDSNSELVQNFFRDDSDTKWFPGIASKGEGVFIRLKHDNLEQLLTSKHANVWRQTHSKIKPSSTTYGNYAESVFRDPSSSTDELHPCFVWWHTLSHLLIRTISEESGYSSPSIRERIYFYPNRKEIFGGILLYATQPSSDGTLGGLTALIPYFESLLNNALEKSRTCSADPLCSMEHFKDGRLNGACCYSCLMNSETSCEHRNMWLDRNVLEESIHI